MPTVYLWPKAHIYLQDILGSTALSEVIIKVATGLGHEIQPHYVSPIRDYAAQMQWD